MLRKYFFAHIVSLIICSNLICAEYSEAGSISDAPTNYNDNVMHDSENQDGCYYNPYSLKMHKKDDHLLTVDGCRNSIEIMAMAASQTGDLYQIHTRLQYLHLGDNFRLDTKGSFQGVSRADTNTLSADGMGKISVPLTDIYAYILGGGNWRNKATDFYYYAVGPGFTVIEGLVLEAGIGHIIAAPGGKRPMIRGALDFQYKFTDYWKFEEKLEVLASLGGKAHYIITSDTIFVYRLTKMTAFKTGIIYTGIDNNRHRTQMLLGLDYKF